MTVHLFGAASSPACATFALRQLAADNEAEFGSHAAQFVRQDFYVDDGLKSLPDVASAISLVKGATALCKKGGLRLHKFLSNFKDVLASVPVMDRAAKLENHDLLEEALPPERVLGVYWCVENDTLGFRIVLKDQPLTRRGVLSTVSAVYDPLGLAAPVLLLGKQILQEMCGLTLEWDDPLPEMLMARWQH